MKGEKCLGAYRSEGSDHSNFLIHYDLLHFVAVHVNTPISDKPTLSNIFLQLEK